MNNLYFFLQQIAQLLKLEMILPFATKQRISYILGNQLTHEVISACLLKFVIIFTDKPYRFQKLVWGGVGCGCKKKLLA